MSTPGEPANRFRMPDITPAGEFGNVRVALLAPEGRREGCKGISPGFWTQYLGFDYVPTAEETAAGCKISFLKRGVCPRYLLPNRLRDSEVEYEDVDFGHGTVIRMPLQNVLALERLLTLALGEEATKPMDAYAYVTHVCVRACWAEPVAWSYFVGVPPPAQLTWRDMIVQPHNVQVAGIQDGVPFTNVPYHPLT